MFTVYFTFQKFVQRFEIVFIGTFCELNFHHSLITPLRLLGLLSLSWPVVSVVKSIVAARTVIISKVLDFDVVVVERVYIEVSVQVVPIELLQTQMPHRWHWWWCQSPLAGHHILFTLNYR